MSLINRFMQDDSGATAIEYGLIAALVAVAIISALGIMKNSLVNTFNKVATSLDSANTAN